MRVAIPKGPKMGDQRFEDMDGCLEKCPCQSGSRKMPEIGTGLLYGNFPYLWKINSILFIYLSVFLYYSQRYKWNNWWPSSSKFELFDDSLWIIVYWMFSVQMIYSHRRSVRSACPAKSNTMPFKAIGKKIRNCFFSRPKECSNTCACMCWVSRVMKGGGYTNFVSQVQSKHGPVVLAVTADSCA